MDNHPPKKEHLMKIGIGTFDCNRQSALTANRCILMCMREPQDYSYKAKQISKIGTSPSYDIASNILMAYENTGWRMIIQLEIRLPIQNSLANKHRNIGINAILIFIKFDS
jgi:hypothetical protein